MRDWSWTCARTTNSKPPTYPTPATSSWVICRAARPSVPTVPTVVMCGHGERAATAASLLERAGHQDVAVLLGGPDDWATATGHALAHGR